MMKKILAAAIVSAFAAPAFAATANVDVYGNLHLSVDYLDNGTDAATNVSSNASRLGFKGAEDLGGGLNAIWQVETTINMDNNNTSFVNQRDTFIGLKGAFGTARLGYFDTPTKQLSRKLDLFNNQIGDTRNLLRTNTATGENPTGTNAWEERFRNGIRYDTPSFGGFTLSAHYSAQTNVRTDIDNDRDAYSVGANYANGPLFVGATYQRNNLTAGTGDETNMRLGAGFNMGALKLTALYSKSEDQRGVSGADRDIWGAGVGYKLGNGQIKAQYYKADDEDMTASSSADLYAVGYDYNLSKRSMVYAAYAKVKNDAGAAFSMSGGGGHGDNVGVAALGADPDGFSIGMVHKF